MAKELLDDYRKPWLNGRVESLTSGYIKDDLTGRTTTTETLANLVSGGITINQTSGVISIDISGTAIPANESNQFTVNNTKYKSGDVVKAWVGESNPTSGFPYAEARPDGANDDRFFIWVSTNGPNKDLSGTTMKVYFQIIKSF